MRPAVIGLNEVQLESRLNLAVDNNRRGEFALLLAMLSDDARDMAQFQLSSDKASYQENLRKKFELPPYQQLVHDLTSEVEPPISHNRQWHQQPSDFYLAQALNPEPLLVRGALPSSVHYCLNNTSPLTRYKFLSSIKNSNSEGAQQEHVFNEDKREIKKSLPSPEGQQMEPQEIDFAALLVKQRTFSQVIV